MKNIMIYSKHTSVSPRSMLTLISENGSMILMYISLACGILTGSYFTVVSQYKTVFAYYSSPIIVGDAKRYFFQTLFFYAVVFFFSCIGALGCFGKISEIVLTFASGSAAGCGAAYFMLTYSWEGLAKYCLSIFPGTVICLCAVLIFGKAAQKVSDDLCLTVFTGQNERIDIKTFLFKGILCLGTCLAGIALNAVLIILFGKI